MSRLRALCFLLLCVKGWLRICTVHPVNALHDPWGIGLSWEHGPPLPRFVPIFDHACVVGEIVIKLGFRILEAETAPQRIDLIWFARQERPTAFDFMRAHITLQCLGSIFLRFESDGLHKDITPHAVP